MDWAERDWVLRRALGRGQEPLKKRTTISRRTPSLKTRSRCKADGVEGSESHCSYAVYNRRMTITMMHSYDNDCFYRKNLQLCQMQTLGSHIFKKLYLTAALNILINSSSKWIYSQFLAKHERTHVSVIINEQIHHVPAGLAHASENATGKTLYELEDLTSQAFVTALFEFFPLLINTGQLVKVA